MRNLGRRFERFSRLGSTVLASAAALGFAVSSGCTDARRDTAGFVTYGDVASLLATRCAACHAGERAPAGWRADSYAGAIGCTGDGRVVTAGGDAAPLLTALGRPDHAGLLGDAERARLRRWIELGAPSTTGGVHPPTFADPRTADGHAQFLRDRRYAPLLDDRDPDACARCHSGTPLPAASLAAPSATACTTCHAEEAGVLACSTCHGGREARVAFPTAGACFSRAARGADAHAAHATSTPLHEEPFACATCHPVPTPAALVAGAHIDGHVEVFFDFARAGRDARFDPATKRCTGTCHARGGERPDPAWNDAARPASCNDCHRSPPPDHYPGACTSCHREANADGTALLAARLHANGKTDVGDGSGGCGACHGSGDDPWPTTGSHPAHAAPAAAASVRCETCHELPRAGAPHPDGQGAKVRLGGLAVRRGSPATFDPMTKTCAATYCHAGRGGAAPAPSWGAGPDAVACGSCHSAPPPPPHVQTASCGGAASCHDGSISSGGVGESGKGSHVDGWVTRGGL